MGNPRPEIPRRCEPLQIKDGKMKKIEEQAIEHQLGGGWGNYILFAKSAYRHRSFSVGDKLPFHGCKLRRPRVGDTLKATTPRWVFLYRFVSVKSFVDPRDYFEAEAELLEVLARPLSL
jgi:hypothetical protein